MDKVNLHGKPDKKVCKDNDIQYQIIQPSNVIDYECHVNLPLLNFIRSIKNNQFLYYR